MAARSHILLVNDDMKKLRNKSVLIIDDDPGMLRALDKVLTGEGADVTCAAWGGDAIEILTARRKRVDLVITDLRMPILTGITVVYAIHEVFPGLPVIVLTAFGSANVKANASARARWPSWRNRWTRRNCSPPSREFSNRKRAAREKTDRRTTRRVFPPARFPLHYAACALVAAAPLPGTLVPVGFESAGQDPGGEVILAMPAPAPCPPPPPPWKPPPPP